MARIDLLTAQMRQRAIDRASVQSDERMQLFDANNQLIGAGAAMPHQTIRDIVTEVAPMQLDGVPVAFPYSGRDGEFEISVAPEGRGFEIRALSFTPSTAEALQTHSQPLTQSVAPGLSQTQTQVVGAPPAAAKDEWYYLSGEQQLGPYSSAEIKSLVRSGGIRRDVYLWREGMGEWQAVGNSEFKGLLPALPHSRGDSDSNWYYRSMTGQPVPLDKSLLVEKIRSGELTSEVWVWHGGMVDWASASKTELASSINARPMGMPGSAGAPIASPSGGGPRTLAGTGPYSVYGGSAPENTSGGGSDVEVPKAARGYFNLGACLFPVFWCHAMGMPSLATGMFFLNIASRYLPFVWVVKLPMCLGLGFMGNRLAWRYRRFNDIQDFKRCQLIWGGVSAAIWGAIILIGFSVGVWSGLQGSQLGTGASTTGNSTLSLPADDIPSAEGN